MGVGSSFLEYLPEGGLDGLLKDLGKRAQRISKKRTKSKVVQTVEQPDGKVLEKRSDDSQRRISPDGSSVETFTDGSVLKKTAHIVLCKFKDGSMLQISDTGDIIEKNVEGSQLQLLENRTLLIVAHADGRQLQWDIPAKTGTEDFPDGRKLEWNEEAGNRVELKQDGTIVTTYSDGCIITKTPEGKLEQANPDGTRICSFADGRRTQYNADNSRIEFFPDGSRVDYRADGVVIKQGSAAKGKKLKQGIDWESAASSLRNRGLSGTGEAVDSEEDSYSDSDFEDAEIGENDAVATGAFIVRGAKFKNDSALSIVETKILKEALSVIPYEMGLDVTAKDVIITSAPAGRGAMKVSFQMRLDASECDTEMAEEVHDEVQESLTEKGGAVFANSLARTSKELDYARWLSDAFSVSYSPAESKLKIPESWAPAEPVEPVVNDGSGGHAALADIADVASGKSKQSINLTRIKRRIKRATKFKTLQGSIKIKGVTGSDFDRSNHHNNALRAGLQEVFQHLGLNESSLRIKLTNVLDVVRKDGLPSASVDYMVTLRGDARSVADSVVQSLKQVFGDSKARKRFMASYWNRIPEEVGKSPSRKKRSKHKIQGSSSANGETKGEDSKHGKRDKKDKKRAKKDKKRSSSRSSPTSGFDSSSAFDSESPMAAGRLSKATSPKLLGVTKDETNDSKRMLPELR